MDVYQRNGNTRAHEQTTAGLGSGSMCLCKGPLPDTGPEQGAIPGAGIVDGMEGMVVGDERKIDTAFPQNWHEPESLRGVPCRCTIKVNELFEWDLPEARAARAGAQHALCEHFVHTLLCMSRLPLIHTTTCHTCLLYRASLSISPPSKVWRHL
jgi:hypothetical protein